MKIGIMGGTFNPIHVGHLALAQTAGKTLELDEIWFIPTGISYCKDGKSILPGEERLKMVSLAIEELLSKLTADSVSVEKTIFKCLDMEIKREGYTYSFETMEQLKSKYPEHLFFFLVGADCLFTVEKWKNPECFFKSCILAAGLRGTVNMDEMKAKKEELELRFDAKIILFPFEPMDVSSTEIRRKVCEGEKIDGLVPDLVKEYIEEKGFYREEDTHCN